MLIKTQIKNRVRIAMEGDEEQDKNAIVNILEIISI